MNSPSVAVVIACYTERRWVDIERAIESASRQVPAAAELLLVVDHNDILLARARQAWPTVTVLANTHQRGLSGARNTGIQASTAELIAFLDDDASARPGWLAELVAPFTDQTVMAVGGWSEPVWTGSLAPSMLPPELWWVVGSSYRGLPTEQSEIRNVIGASMAFRRSALALTGGFDTGLGRVGTLPMGCEETELCIRLRTRNPSARIVLSPRSIVDHRVSPDRETWRYLVRRSYAEGISKAQISALVGAQQALETERDYVRAVLPTGILRELRRGRPAGAVAILASVAAAGLGYLRAMISMRLSRAETVLVPASAEARERIGTAA